MRKRNSDKLLNRVLKIAVIFTLVIILTIFIFTKSTLYCIIFFIGSCIGFLGYRLMIRVVDRVIAKRKGKGLLLLAGLGKMILISVVFIIVSKYSEPAVLFYMLGLSVIILSVAVEGGGYIFRSYKDGT